MKIDENAYSSFICPNIFIFIFLLFYRFIFFFYDTPMTLYQWSLLL